MTETPGLRALVEEYAWLHVPARSIDEKLALERTMAKPLATFAANRKAYMDRYTDHEQHLVESVRLGTLLQTGYDEDYSVDDACRDLQELVRGIVVPERIWCDDWHIPPPELDTDLGSGFGL